MTLAADFGGVRAWLVRVFVRDADTGERLPGRPSARLVGVAYRGGAVSAYVDEGGTWHVAGEGAETWRDVRRVLVAR